MDAIEAILSRRSIRKYTGQKIPESLVEELLKAAMSAPSATNKQPWSFIVINEREILDKIPAFHPYADALYLAPLAVVVCGDSKSQPAFWVQDCAAASENILLAAHAVGLGAVWLSVYPREERVRNLRDLLGLPENIIPLSIISLGYPAEQKKPANRFSPDKIHYNRW